MKSAAEALRAFWGDRLVPRLVNLWSRYGPTLLVLASIFMIITAAGRLSYAFPYLIADPAEWAAIDLKNRYQEVHRWFSGGALYGVVPNADYPPASYALFWPLLGWLPLDSARWLWAGFTALAIGVLALLTVRESGASTWDQRIFAALTVLSIYPTQMNLFVGQVGLHVVALLTAGFVVLRASGGRLKHDLLAAAFLLAALLKPTIAVPFFWIVLFVPRRLRPMVLIGAGYAGLTLLAASYQEEGLLRLLRSWVVQTGSEVTFLEGTVSVHKWLALAGLEQWALATSLMLLLLHGLWTYRNRGAEPWLLIGVAALVARFWVHHRLYDDILIILPMIALFRLAGRSTDGGRVAAGLLFAAAWIGMQVPTWAFYDLGTPISILIEAGHTVIWVTILVFLMVRAGRSQYSSPAHSRAMLGRARRMQ